MGNLNSKSDIEEATRRLSQIEKFKQYRAKFLSLGKDVYFDEDELVVESIGDGIYTIDIFEFDWLGSDVETKIYKELDILYVEYIKVLLEREIRNFIEQSLLEEIEWSDWLNKYCHPTSSINRIFKPSKSFKIGAETIGYPPFYIWYLMLHKSRNDYSLKINGNTVKIINGIEIAVLENINSQWFYVDISEECMKHVKKSFEEQFI